MTLQLDSRRLPVAVEKSAQWRLTTLTHRKPAYGGREARFAKRIPLWKASVTIHPQEADDIIDLIQSQIGSRYAFGARCNAEFDAVDQLLDPDDDGNYPAVKRYGTGDRARTRRIVIPIESTIVVSLDGTPTSSANWTLGPLGVIQPITSPDQNWDGFDVTASFQFDIPVIIESDETAFDVLTHDVRRAMLQLSEVPV